MAAVGLWRRRSRRADGAFAGASRTRRWSLCGDRRGAGLRSRWRGGAFGAMGRGGRRGDRWRCWYGDGSMFSKGSNKRVRGRVRM